MKVKEETVYVCRSEKSFKRLLELLERKGLRWADGKLPTEHSDLFKCGVTIYTHITGLTYNRGIFLENNYGYPVVEFYSDKLTIEELLEKRSENSS